MFDCVVCFGRFIGSLSLSISMELKALCLHIIWSPCIDRIMKAVACVIDSSMLLSTISFSACSCISVTQILFADRSQSNKYYMHTAMDCLHSLDVYSIPFFLTVF